jgi:hypothetical protein
MLSSLTAPCKQVTRTRSILGYRAKYIFGSKVLFLSRYKLVKMIINRLRVIYPFSFVRRKSASLICETSNI